MMHSEQIKKIIRAGIECQVLDVDGDGQHFDLLIVSSQFNGKNRIQRQQCINALLREDFDSGKLHALSMKTYSPDEWEALKNG